MSKDAYYFPHDSNAKDDPKCVLMIEQLGMEGYGIFWLLIETLRDQPDYTYPLNLLPAIARRYNTTLEKVKTVVCNYGLFSVKDDAIFFSQSLINRMIPLERRKESARIAGQKSAEKRALQSISYNDRSTTVEPTLNEGSTIRRDKRRKDKRYNKAIFIAPTLSEIEDYFISEKKLSKQEATFRATDFFEHYELKNWMYGKTKISNWKLAASKSLKWEHKNFPTQTQNSNETYILPV